MKSALIYYSNSGNTKKLADLIIEKFSPDIFEIQLEKPYHGFISSIGRYITNHIFNKEDLIINKPVDFTEYDTVFIGSPVWAGNLPEFVSSFLKTCKLENKQIVPFVTAAKTGKDSTLNHFKELFPDSKIRNYYFQSKFGKEKPDNWLITLQKENF